MSNTPKTDSIKLTDPEQRLWHDVADGVPSVLGDDDPRKLKSPEDWGQDRVIRASVLTELLTKIDAAQTPALKRVNIRGAFVKGELDFSHIELSISLRFEKCIFDGLIKLQTARMASFEMSKCVLPSVIADGASFNGHFEVTRSVVYYGPLVLVGASVRNSINLSGSRIDGSNGISVFAVSVEVGSSLFMRDSFHAKGEVQFTSATIRGYLDCSSSHIENEKGTSLMADNIDISGNVNLSNGFKSSGEARLLNAHIGGQLSFSGATFSSESGKALSADGARVDGDLFFHEGFRAEGEVRIPGAQIGGQLVCSGARFNNAKGIALHGQELVVRNSVILGAGFFAHGEVRFLGAQIRNGLTCASATFKSPETVALAADGAQIGGSVSLDKSSECFGQVRMVGASIGSLRISRTSLINPRGDALSLDYAKIDGALLLRRGFYAHGVVRLTGVTVASHLDCTGGRYEKPDNNSNALIVDGADIRGDVYLAKGFNSVGVVRLLGARIGGKLSCSGGRFHNPGNIAIAADGTEVTDSVLLSSGFQANGAVRLAGAQVGQDLACAGGRIDHAGLDALVGDNMRVKNNALLNAQFFVIGSVSLKNAYISGQLSFTDSTICNPNGYAIILQSARSDSLWLRGSELQLQGRVDLRSSSVRVLADEPAELVSSGGISGIDLDGLVYEHISPDSPSDAHTRLEWLSLQPAGYRSQPFDQLATVLRRNGQDHEAREVLIAKHRARRATLATFRAKSWDRFLDYSVLYGWQPWRPLVFPGAVALLVGIALLEAAHCVGITSGVTGLLPSIFHSLFLALDVSLPIVDLGIRSEWEIDPGRGGAFAAVLTIYLWVLELIGWAVVTLALAALTGIVRRD